MLFIFGAFFGLRIRFFGPLFLRFLVHHQLKYYRKIVELKNCITYDCVT